MADHGSLTRISAGATPTIAGQRRTADNSQQTRTALSLSGSAGQGVGRCEAPNKGGRSVVDLDGKELNRAAPRGTYLNILV